MFYIELTVALIVFAVVAKRYVLPKLYEMSFYGALVPLLLVSASRVTGLNFMVGQVTNNLAAEFAKTAGYGDFTVALIALVAALLLIKKNKLGYILAWLYAVLGAADFIYALYLGNQYDMPLHLGASWYNVTLAGPAMMVTVVLIWVVLLKHPKKD